MGSAAPPRLSRRSRHITLSLPTAPLSVTSSPPAGVGAGGTPQVLTLSRNEIGTVGADAAGGVLKSCSRLRVLDLSWNRIGAAGMASLSFGVASSRDAGDLRELRLARASIPACLRAGLPPHPPRPLAAG